MPRHLGVWLTVLCLSWSALRAGAEDATLPAPDRSDGRFPTFGLALDTPSGWTRVPEESPENIARWVVLAPKTGQPEAILALFVGRSGDGLIAYAQDQARILGGTVAGELQIDGERAILVTANGSASIISKHGGLFYIIGLRQAGGDHVKDFNTLAGSVHWIDIEPPIRHLTLGDAMPALGGTITIRVPACMRPAGAATAAAQRLVATDIVNRREFALALQSAGLSADGTLEQARKNLVDDWNQKIHPELPLEWKVDPAHPEVAITNLVRVHVTNGDQRGVLALQFGLVAHGKQAVLLSFSVKDAPEEDLDGYDDAANNITRSVQFKPSAEKP